MAKTPLAEESALFRDLERLAAAGRHREVLDGLARLPANVREGRTRSALLAAEAHGRLGEHAAAVRWADLARTLARTRGEPHAELRALNYQGLIAELHVALGDLAFAAAELQQAAERYTRIGFQAGLPEVWRIQAAVARATRDVPGAIALLEKAAQLAREFGSTDTLADIERDLGETL